MGNLTCSKCVEELENRLETSLESTVISPQAILNAYSKFYDQEPDPSSITCAINTQSQTDSILQIQRAWRKYKCHKLLKLLQDSHFSSSYFPKQDLKFTISNKFFSNSRKKRKIQYPSGQVFEGDCKGGFRDGYGKMLWPDGCFYEGNWSFGYPEGYGKFVFRDSDLFEGKWVNPFPYCGQSVTSSTRSYDSSNVFSDGFGKKYSAWLHFKQETCEVGKVSVHRNMEMILKSLELTGKVVKQTEDNVKRIEEALVGEGIAKEGGKYFGDIVAGLRQGNGKQVWEARNWFVGQWVCDRPHGFGISTWSDGSRYVGFYKANVKDGVGFYFWENQNSYMGEWSRDVMNGVGRYVYEDGRVYIGEWKEGKIEGFGKFVWNDGRIYEGEWKDGKKHGIGVTVMPDGKKTVNCWKFGRIEE